MGMLVIVTVIFIVVNFVGRIQMIVSLICIVSVIRIVVIIVFIKMIAIMVLVVTGIIFIARVAKNVIYRRNNFWKWLNMNFQISSTLVLSDESERCIVWARLYKAFYHVRHRIWRSFYLTSFVVTKFSFNEFHISWVMGAGTCNDKIGAEGS